MSLGLRDPGTDIGGYTVVEVIGRGGSGDVYRVTDAAGKPAALKLVDASEDSTVVKRLAREVAALQAVRHRAIPRVIDAELDGDTVFVVFELIEGVSLSHHVASHGPLKGEELAKFAETLAAALDAAHSKGVVHRDVTPSNVMMGKKGPVLIDFGLSHKESDERLTREGLVSGTPGYVAPEVIDGAEPGASGDRWSWAAVVAFAMAGEPPFGHGNGAIGRTLKRKVISLPRVPGADAVRAMLRADEPDRPTMRSVVKSLRGATEVLPPEPAADAEDDVPSAPAGNRRPNPTAVMPISGVQGTQSGDGDVPVPSIELPAIEPKRSSVVGAWTTALVAAAAVAPVLSALAIVAWAGVGRTEHRRVVSLATARAKRGTRKGDATLVTVGLPWHFVRALGELVPSAFVGLTAGSGVTALLWWLVSANKIGLGSGEAAQSWGHALALVVGAAVVAAIVWWGPWAGGTRDGGRRLAALVAPTSLAARIWYIVAAVAVAVVVIVVWSRTQPWWWPLPQLPVSSELPLRG